MRCHICNNVLDEVVVDDRDGSIQPCNSCMDVVNDTLYDFESDLDELSLEDYLERETYDGE